MVAAERGARALNVTFHGVRGSTPLCSEATVRYGGNTPCVTVEVAGGARLVLDLGTGLTRLAAGLPQGSPFKGDALVTHLHLDHVQGLPFFAPLQHPDSSLNIYGPEHGHGSLRRALRALIRPPYFPLHLDELPATIHVEALPQGKLMLGPFTITAGVVPHRGLTFGYRVEAEGSTVAYVSDHQAPLSLDSVAPSVLALCESADLLVHEAQYTREQFELRNNWGHCTPEYALLVAREAGVRRLCLFHHDPSRTDDELDRLAQAIRRSAAADGIDDVLVAAEGSHLVV